MDLAGAGAGVFEGAERGLGSTPTRMDPDATLAAGVGEGIGEGGADRIIPPAPVEEEDPANTGAADTAKRKDTQ